MALIFGFHLCLCPKISTWCFAEEECFFFFPWRRTTLESLSSSCFPTPLLCACEDPWHVGCILPYPSPACRVIPQSWPLSELAEEIWVWGTGKGPTMVGESVARKSFLEEQWLATGSSDWPQERVSLASDLLSTLDRARISGLWAKFWLSMRHGPGEELVFKSLLKLC